MSPEESEYRRTIVFRAKKLYRAIKDETDEYNRLDNLYRGETITSLESTADELEAIASDRGSVARVLDLRKAADMKRQRTFVQSHFSPNGNKTNFVKFMAVAERHCPEEARDPEVATLAMCYCTKSEKNPDGIFTVFPKGALQVDDGYQDLRVRTVVRHIHFDLEERINTARDVERYSGWDRKARKYGYRQLSEFSTIGYLKRTYPGLLDGLDPVIRFWELENLNLFQREESEENASVASAWFMNSYLGLVRNGQFYVSNILNKTRWSDHIDEAGLETMTKSSSHTPNIFYLFRLGEEELLKRGLVSKRLIGYDQNQLPPHKLSYKGIWSDNSSLGKVKEEFYRMSLAYELARAGLGTLHVANNIATFTFTKSDFISWNERHLEVYKKSFLDFLSDVNLTGGLEAVAGNSVRKAIKLLLGCKITGCNSAKSMIQKYSSDQFTLRFDLAKVGIKTNPDDDYCIIPECD